VLVSRAHAFRPVLLDQRHVAPLSPTLHQHATIRSISPVLASSATESIIGTSTALFQSSLPIDQILNHNRRHGHSPGFMKKIQGQLNKINLMDPITRWRMAAFAFLSSLLLFRRQFDATLVHIWSFLQHGTSWFPCMFRHDHWEWGLAVTCFFFYIHAYWLIDRAIHETSRGGRPDHPWRKYRLQDQHELQLYQQRKRVAEQNSLTFTETPPKTNLQPWHKQAWLFELPLYALPLYIWDICFPRRAAKLAALSAPTTLQICRDVTCGLLLYDFGFFIAHYLFHKFPPLYRWFHAKHHANTEVRAADIVRLSLVEEAVDVSISILALRFLRCHALSRSIYNIIITFLLTELHCGYDFPWTPQNVIPFGLATGSRRHHNHHRTGHGYYQKFFCHVDRLFGLVEKKNKEKKDVKMEGM